MSETLSRRLYITPLNNWFGIQSPITPAGEDFLTQAYAPKSRAWTSRRYPTPYARPVCTTDQDVFDDVQGYVGRGLYATTSVPRPFALSFAVAKINQTRVRPYY